MINNELYHTTINNSIQDNLRLVLSLLVLIKQSREKLLLIFRTSGIKNICTDATVVVKVRKVDAYGRKLSRILLIIIVWLSSLFIVESSKHLILVDDGRNKY